jgi:glycerol-3-phosphate dehydrogenase subunit B
VTRSVLIVGGGVAGVAAAWAARRAGKKVTLVHRGAGASVLGGGAVDDVPWERLWQRLQEPTIVETARAAKREPPLEPLPAEVSAFVDELALWSVARGRATRLASVAGRVRPARGHDRALLDVGALQGGHLLVPRVPRAGWDADALVAALGDDPLAVSLGLRFAAVDLTILRHDDERRIPDADLAARHDDPARVRWLGERLREGLGRTRGSATAVLMGPWLGIAASAAQAVSAAAGVPVGEALVGVGSPAGLRFAAARDRMLERLGVEVVRAQARAVTRRDARLRVRLEQSTLAADAVVLAIGGVTGGGVAYVPPEEFAEEDMAPAARAPFALSVDAPVTLALRGALIDVVSSMHGPDLDVTAWPDHDTPGVLEAVGVRCEAGRAAEGIFVAGDAIADRPRTLLEAVASGLRAGREA